MPEITRNVRYYPDALEIEHDEGRTDNYGRSVLDLTANEGDLEISLSESYGYDRDNYADSRDAGIDLNEEEAREVLLFITVWLERLTAEKQPKE